MSLRQATLAIMNETNPDKPQWDVALEALLTDSQRAAGQALDQAHLQQLASAHNIRLDDLLDTLCRLQEHGLWQFRDRDGTPRKPDEAVVKMLHANHRLNTVQLERLDGSWLPS
jgi:hypothetical protein